MSITCIYTDSCQEKNDGKNDAGKIRGLVALLAGVAQWEQEGWQLLCSKYSLISITCLS